MVQVGALCSNADQAFYFNGLNSYIKFRFISKDAIHRHLRMAAFGRLSFNNRHIHEYAIDLGIHNSGYEAGLIVTQLLHKVAFSSSTSLVHATDNVSNEKFPFGNQLRNAMNYSLSVGALLAPRQYKIIHRQMLIVWLKFWGQTNLRNGFHYLDLASSLQFIFNSRMRIDLGYRFALIKNYKEVLRQVFYVDWNTICTT
jgi:hypothetical protein